MNFQNIDFFHFKFDLSHIHLGMKVFDVFPGAQNYKKSYFFKLGKWPWGSDPPWPPIDFWQIWSQRSQNFSPSFEYFFWKNNFFLIFWPLLGHFLVQQKFLITPFLAPGQFTTENKAIFGPNQQFFLRQKFDRKGVKYHQNIFGECSLGSKEHLKFWSFWPLTSHPIRGHVFFFLVTSGDLQAEVTSEVTRKRSPEVTRLSEKLQKKTWFLRSEVTRGHQGFDKKFNFSCLLRTIVGMKYFCFTINSYILQRWNVRSTSLTWNSHHIIIFNVGPLCLLPSKRHLQLFNKKH